MNSKIKKQIKKYKQLQDVFRNSKHEERKAKRLFWKDVDLDADVTIPKDSDLKSPPEIIKPKVAKRLSATEAEYWSQLQSPVRLSDEIAKPSDGKNDVYFSADIGF